MRARFVTDSTCDRSMEWFSSLVMLAWCCTLVLPGNMLKQPVFAEFLRWGLSVTHWIAIFGAVAIARIVALFINGRWPQGPVVRMVGAAIGAMIWVPICIMATDGSLRAYQSLSPSTGIYALLAAADLLAIRRAAHDARYFRC